MAKEKIRADHLLVLQNPELSKNKAAALILSGKIYHQTTKIAKAGILLSPNTQLTIKRPDHPWVSRGGIKLDHALKQYPIEIANKIALDIGASTGGFCDVLLAHNIKKIYAVDVGYNQLHWKLVNHSKIINKDKTNARYLTQNDFSDFIDIVTCDVSFINLEKVFASLLPTLHPKCYIIALIKPQFEAGIQFIGKGGIVKDAQIHDEICEKIICWFKKNHCAILNLTPSPITGQKGNKEFLLTVQKL